MDCNQGETIEATILNSNNEGEAGNAMDPIANLKRNSYHPKLLQMPPSCSIDIAFENISYKAPKSMFSKDKKTILKGVSGLFKSGELTAIMGPSGAGKSSLLNVLSGFIEEGVTGNIFANQRIEKSDRKQIRACSSYIMQDDHFLACFTVMETMMHAANLKLTKSHTKKSKILLIENILESMSLGNAQNTRCDKLSGGQRKRLNICLELIDNPPILFLDEPTTGLDSSNSLLLVSELKGLSKAGRTVICTIHQPSTTIFTLFDHLYLMSSGSNIYQGDTNKLVSFLECIGLPCPISYNPADFVMDVASGEFGSYTDSFAVATESKNWRTEEKSNVSKGSKLDPYKKNSNIAIPELRKEQSEWERFKYLVCHFAKHSHRDRSIVYTKIYVHLCLGLIIGLLFKNVGSNGVHVLRNLGYVSAALLYMSYTTLIPAASKFPAEINILKKEHFNNWYKFRTYYLALLCVQIPIQAVLTFVYFSITYYLTGQIREPRRFLLFLAVGFNCSLYSLLVGLLVGTLGGVNGVFIGSIFCAFTILLGGYIAVIKYFPFFLYIASYINYLRYSFEVILVAIYGLDRGKLSCPDSALYCHLRFPELLFKELGFEQDYLLRNSLILCFITISQAVITCIRLRHSLKTFRKLE